MSPDVLRIANASGFYGDRFSAPREMLEGGPIDVLTGDYLAELTLHILWKARQKDAGAGYATTFLGQMEQVLGEAQQRGVKIVTNAGGLNPAGLREQLAALASRLGLRGLKIAHIEGDDLLARLPELQAGGHALAHQDDGRALADAGVQPLLAHAYLGGWPIAAALQAGADVVVCPRVSDASLVLGPAAWHFGWGRDDWDRLAGAVVAGHVLECGAQATGGNYAFFREIADLRHPGFPLAELHADGSCVITKHPGTGGAVSVGTVTAQLLYEIEGARYLNPDVVARFDSIRLAQQGPDRVAINGVRGEPAPLQAKLGIHFHAGYRNAMTLALTGLEIEHKARLVSDAIRAALGERAGLELRLVRSDREDAATNDEATAFLHVSVRDADRHKVGRAFTAPLVELALASYPGLYAAAPPQAESAYGGYWPTLVPAACVAPVVVSHDGTRIPVPMTSAEPCSLPLAVAARPPVPTGATVRVPLGRAFGARSGDKGQSANLGVWARSPEGYGWLCQHLDVTRLKLLIGEVAPLEVIRHELPNLLAVNFVIRGLLGDRASTRMDAQAKSLGEHLRSRVVELPESLAGG